MMTNRWRFPTCVRPAAGASAGAYFGLSRRALLFGSVAFISAANSKVTAIAATTSGTEEAAFLKLSKALTGYADLDPLTAARIASAFATLSPDLSPKFPKLEGLVGDADVSPESLLASASAAGLKDVALALVAAWYTGTIGSGVKAVTVSYRDALMQRPVADGLAPPTYVLGGPGWWAAAPPDVGLASPATAPTPPKVSDTPEASKP
jgi:hypothetical protein